MSFRYALAILTHGDATPLPDTLSAFAENVTPAPARTRVVADAISAAAYAWIAGAPLPNLEVTATSPMRQMGFCAATARLWNLAAGYDDVDYVFWLEHDFRTLRPIDLRPLAYLLDNDPRIAQISLMRNAVNEQERRAGGLYAARRDEFYPEIVRLELDQDYRPATVYPWLRHRSYFTTNPSLMTREFMRDRPFSDDGRPFCEGRYGLDLVADGYSFGVWGEGDPWVEHVGERDPAGTGY